MLIENNNTIDIVDRWHEAHQELPRPHLGCSEVGQKCERWVWLNFRWAVIRKRSGRMLRLLRRGQSEEARVVADLTAVGCVIEHTGENQIEVAFSGHLLGHLDGIITSGLPEAPKTPHLLEIKTHNDKSFSDLIGNGKSRPPKLVRESKQAHWVQCQLYMLGAKLKRAFYHATNKDNEATHQERICFDKAAALKWRDVGLRLSLTERMPPPISNDPTWWECKMCGGHTFCHKEKLTREVNCRTCAHVTPMKDGSWACDVDNVSVVLSVDEQRAGCHRHALHPDLVPWEWTPGPRPTHARYLIRGTPVENGEATNGGVTSVELVEREAKPSRVSDGCGLSDL